ncbi:AarF/UbiB family protein [Amycolatopsis sp. NPDC049253]|uniref:AarF/UbiB family protein n=1 Tax=Amycolatopsis sp. NPDC049253 TaxID=3155274 RepID=UPI003420F3B8
MFALLREELGADPADAFAEFDPEPLAAASIAQAYDARLHSGAEVVIKVQRPGMPRSSARSRRPRAPWPRSHPASTWSPNRVRSPASGSARACGPRPCATRCRRCCRCCAGSPAASTGSARPGRKAGFRSTCGCSPTNATAIS